MDLRDTPEEAAFRSGLRTWLEEHLPDDLQGHRGGATRFDGPEMREWSRALYDAGYVGLTWPEEYGGGGAPYTHQAIFLEEMARAEAPPHIGVIGIGMGHPAVAEAAVIAVPDEKWSERPLAVVVLREGEQATPDELREFLAPSFAKWWLPDRFEFVTEIPKTSVGKFKKTELRDMFSRVPA